MIDVSHHRYHWRARHFDVVSVGRNQFLELFFRNHLFERHERNVVTKALAQIRGDIVVQRLVDRGEYAALKQQRDDILWFDPEFLGEFFNRRSFNEPHRLQSIGLDMSFHSTRDSFFER